MRIFLESIGCRLNQSEIESLARRLLAAGHEIVADVELADKVVINTCAVTAEAARDARRLTRRIHRANPSAEILVTGCYATVAPGELERLDGVRRVVSNQEKDGLAALIDPEAGNERALYESEPLLRVFLQGRLGNTRAFVKVQDGCDNRCTFCITTVARGDGRSRALGDVAAEVQTLQRAGYQEAVLTGVHLGSYGRDLGLRRGLADLVRAILERTEIPRLRLSSLEPWDIAPDFFTLWRDPRLLPHLHLPLQAGCDRTLKRMARNTGRGAFRALVHAAREAIPDLNVSTDIIAGFPGETESDFEESLDFVRELAFARLHVFPYSPRPGTPAADFPGQVPPAVKRERARRMLELGAELSRAFHARYVGRRVRVLWEAGHSSGSERRWQGYTDNYIRVATWSAAELFNRVVPAEIEAADEEGLSGKLASAS
jgi:threonylcarbamoyladenosine tRNA methylthiotransferase MtaB